MAGQGRAGEGRAVSGITCVCAVCVWVGVCVCVCVLVCQYVCLWVHMGVCLCSRLYQCVCALNQRMLRRDIKVISIHVDRPVQIKKEVLPIISCQRHF